LPRCASVRGWCSADGGESILVQPAVRTYPSEGSGPVLHLALSSHAGAVGAAEETLVRLDTVADDLILQYSQLGARAWIAHTNLPNVWSGHRP
jgi:hypothetical protein